MPAEPITNRLRETALSPSDRNVAVWLHLLPLMAFMVIGPFAGIAPFLLWMGRREISPFDDDHGREVVNMSLTGALIFVAGLVTGVAMLLWVAWLVVTFVNVIRGAIAASAGEYFRYPMTLRFLT
jgi:uncharacterized Tic20 family protein